MQALKRFRGVTVMILAATLAAGSGCVLVVGADGGHRRGEVEWAGSGDRVVRAERARADGSLAREVETRLHQDSALAREDITVSSRADVVTLHGRLSDIVLLEHAMRIAAEVPGVARVVSRLTVEMEVG